MLRCELRVKRRPDDRMRSVASRSCVIEPALRTTTRTPTIASDALRFVTPHLKERVLRGVHNIPMTHRIPYER